MDETLMSICAETQGFFEMDAESGEPMETWVYAKLIQLGYASQSLASADEKDGLSMNYLSHLAHPGTDAVKVIGKMHPACLKYVIIIQKCKLGISATAANNVINKDGENAHNASYIRQKIGDFERKTEEHSPPSYKSNGWLWGIIAGQVERSSLEWLPWERFLSMWEFDAKRNTGQKAQIPTIEDGKLVTANEFGSISTGLNSLKLGKTPYFSKVSKSEK